MTKERQVVDVAKNKLEWHIIAREPSREIFHVNIYVKDFTRGLSGYDVPFKFVLSHVYDLPFFRHSSDPLLLKYALGGWSLAGILTLQSGFPFTVTWPVD